MRRATATRAVLAAEHGAGQSVDGVVGDPDGVVVVLVADDDKHRPEHLVLGDLAVRVDIGEKCRRIEEARAHLLAAGHQRRACLDGALDHAVDLVALLLADQRARVGALVGGVAVAHHPEVVLQLLDDLVVVGARHQYPCRDRTALTGVAGRGECGEKRRHVEVAVVEHDRRRLPAEFEEYLLARLAGRGHDRPAGRRRAGEGDHVDVGARRQGDTDFGVGTADSTLTTPAGISVWLAISSPSASVINGVSGAPFSTTVHPAASAGASLASASCVG